MPFFITSDETIIGEVKVAEYEKTMGILEKVTKKPFLLSQHKNHIKERILDEKRYADRERKGRFMNDDC